MEYMLWRGIDPPANVYQFTILDSEWRTMSRLRYGIIKLSFWLLGWNRSFGRIWDI